MIRYRKDSTYSAALHPGGIVLPYIQEGGPSKQKEVNYSKSKPRIQLSNCSIQCLYIDNVVREVIPLLDSSWKVTLLVSKCSCWRSYYHDYLDSYVYRSQLPI